MHKPAFPPELEEWKPLPPPFLPIPMWVGNPIPPGVSVWGERVAVGVARRGGLIPNTPAYATFVENYSKALSQGLMRKRV